MCKSRVRVQQLVRGIPWNPPVHNGFTCTAVEEDIGEVQRVDDGRAVESVEGRGESVGGIRGRRWLCDCDWLRSRGWMHDCELVESPRVATNMSVA